MAAMSNPAFFDKTEQELENEQINKNIEEPEIFEISKKGYRYLKENRLSSAVDCFSRILAVDENNNYALVGMGDAARKRGLNREAIVYYQRCLSVHPGNNYALFGLADCYKALNQYQKAIDIWEQYLLHDNKNITILTRVADAYRKVRNFSRSKLFFERVLEMEENNPYAIIGLGRLYYDFMEYDTALYYWEKMYNLHNKNPDIRVLTSIGNCYRKLKTFKDGIPYFEAAFQREQDNFYALFGLADCYRGLNNHERSLVYWRYILEQDPGNKAILTRAGDACRTTGDYGCALDYYNRALNIEFDVYAVLGLALTSKAKGNYDEAIESLKQLINQDNRNYRLFIELAQCYNVIGNRKKAVETLESFQRLGIKNSAVSEMLEKL
jgi:tetratricopeptide (TPR) repeat protein